MTEQFYSEATTFTSSAGVAVQRAPGYIQNYCSIPMLMLSYPNFSRHAQIYWDISRDVCVICFRSSRCLRNTHLHINQLHLLLLGFDSGRDSITLCKVIYYLALIHERKLHCNSSYSSLERKKVRSDGEEEKEAEGQKKRGKESERKRARGKDRKRVKQGNESSL